MNAAKRINFKPDVVIFGIMNDKDHMGALKEIKALKTKVILTKPEYERALEPGILYTAALRIFKKSDLLAAARIKDSLLIAEKLHAKKIMILGSFFVVSDAMKACGFKHLPGSD